MGYAHNNGGGGTGGGTGSGTTPAIVTPGNLINNSSFETGSLSSWGNFGGGVVQGSDANSGSYCANISPNGGICQNINVQPNTSYVFKAYCKVESGNPSATLVVQNFSGGQLFPSNGNVVNDGKYDIYSISFTTGPSDTSVQVGIWSNAGSSGTVVCDDFSLVAGS